MEWETGETPPGRVMSNLKTAGLPDLLRALVEVAQSAAGSAAVSASESDSGSTGQ